ncbi:MAG: hypothetical protein OXC14_20060 [Rhodospirillaceae bacterium]|nr:hypothetical protein [Rhodospirillaceae bacterium]
MDILVTDENSWRLCAIQVKTRRATGGDGGWHMQQKHEKLVADDLFYVFVEFGKQPSDTTVSYVLPSRVVAGCIRDYHRVWLNTPGRRGQRRNESEVRRLLPDYSSKMPNTEEGRNIRDRYGSGWLELYREKWSILGLPEADGS